MDSQRLTLLIPCKNEADNISACIQSVGDLADEILVADSGSTDATRELARQAGATRVIEREFINSGDFKNWAIPQAQHAWVFVLDADERMTPELISELRRLLASKPSYDGYWVRRVNHFMGHRLRHTSWARDKVIRFMHRDRARYNVATDHCEVQLPAQRVGTLREPLVHYTCWDYDAYLAKMLHYTEQQAELWYRAGRQPSFLKMMVNGPLRFARSYVVDLGFLDGWPGLQVSALTGFYSYLKQARLWHKYHGRQRGDLDRLPSHLS